MTLNGAACYHQLSMGERSLADLARTLAEAGDVLLVDDAWFLEAEWKVDGWNRTLGWNMCMAEVRFLGHFCFSLAFRRLHSATYFCLCRSHLTCINCSGLRGKLGHIHFAKEISPTTQSLDTY